MKLTAFHLVGLCIAIPAMLMAQTPAPGSLDTNFIAQSSSADIFWGLAVQTDGKIIAAGREGSGYGVIYRFNTNGNVDPSFFAGTRATCADATIPQINAMALQTNGNIIVAGAFTYFDDLPNGRLAQLKPSGALDSAFAPYPNNAVNTVAIQPDGKILIGGKFTNFKKTGRNYLARLNPDGVVDATFNPDGTGPNGVVNSIVLTTNGNILIGGDFTLVNGQPLSKVARLTSDGSADASFTPGAGANDTVETIAVQPNGKIMVGGWFSSFDSIPRNRIVRLNDNGTVDTTFDPGTGCDSRPYAFAFQDDLILAAGRFNTYNGSPHPKIVRLQSNGIVDTNFDQTAGSGTASTDEIRAMKITPGGDILVAGKFTIFSGQPRYGIARLLGNSSTNSPVLPPTLHFQQINGDIQFNWAGQFILQSTTNVAEKTSWQDVSSNSPSVVTNHMPAEFFRLRN